MSESVQARIRIGNTAPPKRRSALLAIVLAFGGVAAALIAIFHVAEWHAETVSLYRYCDESKASLFLIDRILTDRAPAEIRQARSYVVAAKLIYLVPQRQDETVPAYLARLQNRIEERCQ